MYHGYRFVHRRTKLKKNRGYIIPTTNREDSTGIDFMVKPRGESRIVPVQITQRGTALYKKHSKPSSEKIQDFIQASERRIKDKRKICARHKILFVLVRDYDGKRASTTIACGDSRRKN